MGMKQIKQKGKIWVMSKSNLVDAQAKSGPTGREKARRRIRFQNRTEMGTNVQDLESPAEEFVFYLVDHGESPKMLLMKELLSHRTDKPFGGDLIILSFSEYCNNSPD